VLYVGDRPDVDAQAATAAGVTGVWLNRSAIAFNSCQPTITSLPELPALLQQ
jgi:putative hydrolase of the HAD superfamily